MPQGLWDGKQGHVVHCLPLEEGLPAVHRLSQSCLSFLPKAQGRPFLEFQEYNSLVELKCKNKGKKSALRTRQEHQEGRFPAKEKPASFALCLVLKLDFCSSLAIQAHFTERRQVLMSLLNCGIFKGF